MSVAGIDVGNATSCVALARKRGVDVIMNKESKRETPSMASFSFKQRFLGTDAIGVQSTNIKNTVSSLKRLLGKKFAEPDVQEDISRLPYKVTEGPKGECMINVQSLGGEEASFTPEAVMGMILADLKVLGEKENNNIPITDCVVSVPIYYTDAERHAMLDATRIAGLNCLRLMNDTAATALGYGIMKSDLPEDKPIHVAIIDIGEMAMQVCVIALQKGKLKVLSSAWDRKLGGSNFDDVLFEHFAKEIQEKYKLDVKTSPRAQLRLRLAIEKMKKILTSNPEAPLNVECLMEDTDIASHLKREKFEELAAESLGRIKKPLESALEQAGLKPKDIDTVEMVGGSSRVPAVFDLIKSFFGKEPNRTMNAKECVSRGCALQCAMLSPIFRVRDFNVEEAVPYTVNFTWDKEPGQPTTSAVFQRGNPIPSTKMLTFYKSEPFSMSADYDNDGTANLPNGSLTHIGDFTVGPPIPIPSGEEKAKLKVKVHINLHGILSIESVQAVEETEVVEPAPEPVAPAPPTENGEKPAEGGEEKPADAEMADAEATAAPAEPKKTVKVTKKEVPFTAVVPGMHKDVLAKAIDSEKGLQKHDHEIEETNERKNALEGYVYDMRNKMYSTLTDFIAEEAKAKFCKDLDTMENWLYDEGEDAERSVYIAKLDELKKVGEPVEERYQEMSTRGPAAEALTTTCSNFTAQAQSGDPKYDHIDAEAKQKVVSECQDALEWLQQKQSLQDSMPKHEIPVLMTVDIKKKMETIIRVCEPIMNKPKPAPPKPEPKEEEAAPAAAEGEAMETDASAEGEAAATEEPMET